MKLRHSTHAHSAPAPVAVRSTASHASISRRIRTPSQGQTWHRIDEASGRERVLESFPATILHAFHIQPWLIRERPRSGRLSGKLFTFRAVTNQVFEGCTLSSPVMRRTQRIVRGAAAQDEYEKGGQ